MVRLTWLSASIIAGGVIITTVAVIAVAVAKARAEEEKKKEEEIIPPAPPTPPTPVPGIPVALEFPAYPTSLNQFYGFYYYQAYFGAAQVLQVSAQISFAGPPYQYGLREDYATLRVVDAAGRGVPNVAVLIWSVPTRDDQSGQLSVNGATRTEVEALRLLTDANGEIKLTLSYELTNIKMLEDRLNFGVCTPAGRVKDIDVGGSSELGPPLAWICYKQREARTDPRVYTVNARIEGTVKSNTFVISCQTTGKALW